MAVASITPVDAYDRREFQRKQIIVYLGDLERPGNPFEEPLDQYFVDTGFTTNDALTVNEYISRQGKLIALKSKLVFITPNLFRGETYFELQTRGNRLVYSMFYDGHPLSLKPEVKELFEKEMKVEISGACIVSTNMILKYPSYYVSGLLREYQHKDLITKENVDGVYLFTREDIPITETLITDLTLEIFDYINGCADMGLFPLSTPENIIQQKGLIRHGNYYVSDYGRIAVKDTTITVHVDLSSLYEILKLLPDVAVLSNRGMKEFVVTGDFNNPEKYTNAKQILTAEYPEIDVKYTVYRYQRDVREDVKFLDIRTNHWLGLSG